MEKYFVFYTTLRLYVVPARLSLTCIIEEAGNVENMGKIYRIYRLRLDGSRLETSVSWRRTWKGHTWGSYLCGRMSERDNRLLYDCITQLVINQRRRSRSTGPSALPPPSLSFGSSPRSVRLVVSYCPIEGDVSLHSAFHHTFIKRPSCPPHLKSDLQIIQRNTQLGQMWIWATGMCLIFISYFLNFAFYYFDVKKVTKSRNYEEKTKSNWLQSTISL